MQATKIDRPKNTVKLKMAGRLLLISIILALLFACNKSAKEVQQRPKKDHLVETTQLKKQQLSIRHERTGTLKFRHKVRIYNQEEGRITQLPFYEGDWVKQGQRLLSLDGELLEAELSKAQAMTRQAKLNLQRISKLAKKRAASEDERTRAITELDIAKAERRVLETRLRNTHAQAPFSGIISKRLAEPGDVVSRYTHILTLSDPSSLVTELKVSEILLAQLSKGDPVKVRIDALGSQQFNGHITRIFPELDPKLHMGIIEVTLDEIPKGAIAGQSCRVTLNSATKKRLMIPFAALNRDRRSEFVYLLSNDSQAQRTAVKSGIRIAEKVEILQGLEPENTLIIRGFLGLRDGKKVKQISATNE